MEYEDNELLTGELADMSQIPVPFAIAATILIAAYAPGRVHSEKSSMQSGVGVLVESVKAFDWPGAAALVSLSTLKCFEQTH